MILAIATSPLTGATLFTLSFCTVVASLWLDWIKLSNMKDRI